MTDVARVVRVAAPRGKGDSDLGMTFDSALWPERRVSNLAPKAAPPRAARWAGSIANDGDVEGVNLRERRRLTAGISSWR